MSCRRCGGSGHVASEATCEECKGQPFVNVDGHMMVCEACQGTGKKNEPCPVCNRA